eukprot:CAMPEP_0172578686 /NCGR_PEP_ID=MMETSP1067-20121228/138862_1 /TAXON_ID=265564 ORGANISM="Thalassiosira punctigera, Strain Tpunct2005C2" /NCGR_SAMPLE_ID=MMETSP1067 /ASSEMBLY_ACC=CAM_ASM_000444 /LENGTH=155 /DNA_ID=CAMNT_0013371385 /DNA_START=189 /DNA_END=653 /DNA_ORIENTATION=+
MDSLDPRKVTLDVFEFYCREILTTTTVERRALLVQHLQYIVRRLITYEYNFGRMYNRTCITNIVSRVCGRHAYAMPDEVDARFQPHQLRDCLVDFTPRKWKTTIFQFGKLRESLLRNDASLIILPSQIEENRVCEPQRDGDDEDTPLEDEEINEA